MLELSLKHPKQLSKVAHALASEVRLQIIDLLNTNNLNIHQLADQLNIPVSTAASHVKILEEAWLIHTELRPAKRGAMKVCKRTYDDIHVQLKKVTKAQAEKESYEVEMPIGQYTDFEVAPTCGMADEEKLLIPDDKPAHFYNPARGKAQLIWTRKGYLEYKFPIVVPNEASISNIQFSLEICSEAPNHDHNWPSDITVWINEKDIGTWTSPGDFGDRPGKLNPSYWAATTGTQYGTLKTWKVTREKTMLDDFYLSDVTVDDLELLKKDYITFRIGIKEDAIHKGGMNIFGRKFGDYEQDIKLKIDFV